MNVRMSALRLAGAFYLLLISAPAGQAASPQPKAPRAIILSLDGVVPAEVNELLRSGKLPNLQRLVSTGAFSDSVITTFPSKTAPGHAALWTGAPSRVNGVSGNRTPPVPRNSFTILDNVSGFHSTSLKAEPLWVTAARQGRETIVVQATHAWPFEPYTQTGFPLTLFEGYAAVAGDDGVVTGRSVQPARDWANLPLSSATPLEVSLPIAGSHFFGLLIDDPADQTEGYDTLFVARSKDARAPGARLKKDRAAPIDLDDGGKGVYLCLLDLARHGNDFLLYFTRPGRQLSSRIDLIPRLFQAAGPFTGNGAARLYRLGAFGVPLFRGGDGEAERRYLRTVVLAQRQRMEATVWAMRELKWDLLFTYSPFPDEAEHLWRGYLDSSLGSFDATLAKRLRPFLEEVYRTCDEFIGLLMARRPADALIALVSDHGVEGTERSVAINTALERAGLLTLDRSGRVDLKKTKALYPATNNGYILINGVERREGIVKPGERAEVVDAVRRALGRIRDRERRVVTAVIDVAAESEALGIGGEGGGDLYLDLLSGYDFDARLRLSELVSRQEPSGAHGFNPIRRTMRTFLALNGPGVAAGKQLDSVRVIDVAPTLAHLLGLTPPRQANGRILAEALTR
jgi:predicted AlkP superfamily phosphohydrolase/phosphomutase